MKIVGEAYQIVIPLAGALMALAWWVRGRIERGAKEGLQEQNKALEAHRHLAEARSNSVTEHLNTANAQLVTLQSQIREGASPQTLSATVHSASVIMTGTSDMSADLTKILRLPQNAKNGTTVSGVSDTVNSPSRSTVERSERNEGTGSTLLTPSFGGRETLSAKCLAVAVMLVWYGCCTWYAALYAAVP